MPFVFVCLTYLLDELPVLITTASAPPHPCYVIFNTPAVGAKAGLFTHRAYQLSQQKSESDIGN